MILKGDGRWPFQVEFAGTLSITHVICTWFGGDDDPQDNGKTASGVVTKGHPDLMGCSLPMELCMLEPATRGSPIPRLPWGMDKNYQDIPAGAHVTVWEENTPGNASPPLSLIDLGPALSASHQFAVSQRSKSTLYRTRARIARKYGPHAIDLTQAAFKALGGDLNIGIMWVSYQITG